MSEIIHEVVLPSSGIPYTSESGIKDTVTIRAITTVEEKLIYGSGTDSAITKALKACIVSPEKIDIGELTIPDKHFLVVAWRALSYGPDYVTSGRCGVCGNTHEYNISIQTLVDTVTLLDPQYAEPYEITLPESKDVITLRFLRDRDIRLIEREVTNLKRIMKTSDPDADIAYPYRIASYIKEVNGKELSLIEKVRYLEKLIGRDTSYIMYKANKMNDFGIDPIVSVQCKSCDSDLRVGVPIDVTFFRAYFND